MNLLYLIAVGATIYMVMRFGGRLLEALPVKPAYKREIDRWLPIFEGLIWVVFVFWGVYLLFGGIRHYDLLLLIMAVLLMFGVAWYFFRDYFAGMMIKSDYKLRKGQHIKTPLTEGVIVRLGSRFLELENDHGEKIRIPFSALSKQWVQLPADMQKSLSNQLVVHLPASSDPIMIKSLVASEMMGMPWIIGTPPTMKLRKNRDGDMVLDIRFDLLREEHSVMVEDRIRRLIMKQTSTEAE